LLRIRRTGRRLRKDRNAGNNTGETSGRRTPKKRGIVFVGQRKIFLSAERRRGKGKEGGKRKGGPLREGGGKPERAMGEKDLFRHRGGGSILPSSL